MYTSIKTLAAAIALPLVAALPLSHRSDAVFDSSKPFTLHTEVVNGTSAFCGQYLTSFHVGAGQSTVVGSKNSSIAIGWDSILQHNLAHERHHKKHDSKVEHTGTRTHQHWAIIGQDSICIATDCQKHVGLASRYHKTTPHEPV
ncbi:hypothetical protein AUEXF2481DRAFT_610931 [Aureobasidium subglaciale EXF-2481]|uniref:DUF7907 domain-containing protein n=1 Tax=Aureobasidium subglaciale (strain EXF-2481) TaxID=1043005 RepID=A0A074ZDJ7_AURSE|nr:uncharacterized protein AUEXF2481DRAFT_610931 [Aureobasidium subglaciale EXF-2481]KEQ96751.1 hypothetical protein AUEXF2481DRAFT_610931 [Aureobasidium subglaciale EXF-2481]